MRIGGPDLTVAGGTTVPLYRACGLAGVGFGLLGAAGLGWAAGVPGPALATAAALAASGCLAVIVLRAALGPADWVWSEHEAAAVVGVLAAGLLWGIPRELLDVAAPALLVVLAAGRLGCGFAGCCHGRPARRGIVYSARHAEQGLPSRLVGVPLAPVQLWEAVGAAALAVASGWLGLAGAPAGAAAVLALGGRAGLRAYLERHRGDPRPAWGRLTVPRWWALGSAVTLCAITLTGTVPAGLWTLPAAVTAAWLCATALVPRTSRDHGSRHRSFPARAGTMGADTARSPHEQGSWEQTPLVPRTSRDHDDRHRSFPARARIMAGGAGWSRWT